jgi:hypothetical protein
MERWEGFNEFDKQQGIVRIFRWGFPGNNRRIDISYSIDDVKAIRVELMVFLLDEQSIFVLKDNVKFHWPELGNQWP